MTVKYQLSRDEFAEVYRFFRPAPDCAVSVVTILVAVAVVILAIFADWANRGYGASAPAWMLLLIGTVLFGTAIWQLTIGALIRRVQFSRRVSSAYQEYFAGKEKEFAFDEEKWSNDTQTGPSESLWGQLQHATEYKTVISLTSETGFAVIPKRVFAPEQLSALRKFAFGEFGAPITFRVGLRDYFHVEIPSLWRRKKDLMALAHAGGSLLAAAIAWACWSTRGQADAVWLGAMAGIMFFITVGAQFLWVLTAYVTRPRQAHVSWQAEFLDRGAHVKTVTAEHFSSWPVFAKFRETEPAFLLYSEPERYYILPKTYLTPDMQSALRQQLSSKLQSA